MPYADAVLKEAMRRHGIVDGIWREALEDLQIQGRRVPKVRALIFSSQSFRLLLPVTFRHLIPAHIPAQLAPQPAVLFHD